MNGELIIKNIAKKFSLDEKAVSDFISAINTKILQAFKKGKGINIPEFGKFFVINKVSEGKKVKTISFSPAKKFADSVNEDFADLSPEIIAAGSLKIQNEIKIVEIPYEFDDLEMNYFVFDDSDVEDDILQPVKTDSTLVSTSDSEIKENVAILTEDLVKEANIFLPEDEKINSEITDNYPDSEIALEQIPVTEEDFTIQEKSSINQEENRDDNIRQNDISQKPDSDTSIPGESIHSSSVLSEFVIPDVEKTEVQTSKEVSEEKQSSDIQQDLSEDVITPKDDMSSSESSFEELTEIIKTPYSEPESEIDSIDDQPVISEILTEEVQSKDEYDFQLNQEEKVPESLSEKLEETPYSEKTSDHSKNEEISDTEIKQTVFSDEVIIVENIKNENVSLDNVQQDISEIEPSDSKTNIEYDSGDELSLDMLKDQNVFEDIDAEILGLLKEHKDLFISLDLLNKGIVSPEQEINEADDLVDISDKEVSTDSDIFREEKSDEELIEKTEDSESKRISSLDDDTVIPLEELTDVEHHIPQIPDEEIEKEIERKIDELKRLEALREELQMEEKASVSDKSMVVFEKLIDETETSESQPQESIVNVLNETEPSSLSDVLQEVEIEGIDSHSKSPDEMKKVEEKNDVNSFDDVFSPNNEPVLPQFLTDDSDKKLGPRSYLKFFLYLFFVFLLATFSFYIYKKVLIRYDKPLLIDTGLVNDSINKLTAVSDTAKTDEPEIKTIEDVIVETEGDIIYRKMNDEYRIQINAFSNLSDAERFLTNLKEKNFEAKIERADLPMNRIEYRIVIGPFETLDEAKSYYNSSSMILNFIKVLTPANTGLRLM